MNFPSIFVHRDSRYVQIVLNFFQILTSVHRVHSAVKHTDCLSFLRLLPPGISKILKMECNSLAFPMWWMYSAKSSGNSTLSCNVGSTRVLPECPWIARKYRKFFKRIEVQAVLKPFLRSSYCQKSYPSFKWPLRRTIKLCLELFCQVVSQILQLHHLLDELYHHVVPI